MGSAEVARPRVSLTFDNGPTPGVTESVLDLLSEREIGATFFVVGNDLLRDGRRELAERAASEGHQHGNHTLTHCIQLGMSSDAGLAQREIGDAQEILGDLSHADRLFRPWGDGRISPTILSKDAVEYMCANDFTCVLWNSVPRDWEDPIGWVDKALADIELQDWTVLVIHDQATGAMDSLQRFFDRAGELEVEFSQEFPDSCVPIRRGVPTGPLNHLVPRDSDNHKRRKS